MQIQPFGQLYDLVFSAAFGSEFQILHNWPVEQVGILRNNRYAITVAKGEFLQIDAIKQNLSLVRII